MEDEQASPAEQSSLQYVTSHLRDPQDFESTSSSELRMAFKKCSYKFVYFFFNFRY